VIRTDIDKTLEQRERADQWRRESAQRWQEKRRRALVDVNRQGAKTVVRRTPLKPVSDKRRVENREYSQRRKQFLEENPLCVAADLHLPGVECEGRASTVQHAAGRSGERLNDETHWLEMCWPCHSWAELHPTESDLLGLSVPRIGVAS
jgi:hypothetical protein